MLKKLSANSDRVIVKPVEAGEERFGSIILPDMGKERPEMGEVVSTGPGRQSEFGQFIVVQAKVGDVVLIPKVGTIRIDFEGDEYFILPDREILATIKSVEE
jgi:chaperonin GroES